MSPPLPRLLARQLVLQGRVSAGEPCLCPRDPLQQISYCRLGSGDPSSGWSPCSRNWVEEGETQRGHWAPA